MAEEMSVKSLPGRLQGLGSPMLEFQFANEVQCML